MYQNDCNEFGVPLRYQTGDAAIYNFDALLAQLPADLRDAFETERDERQAEFDAYVAAHGYNT
jgi:hypothetical protein